MLLRGWPKICSTQWCRVLRVTKWLSSHKCVISQIMGFQVMWKQCQIEGNMFVLRWSTQKWSILIPSIHVCFLISSVMCVVIIILDRVKKCREKNVFRNVVLDWLLVTLILSLSVMFLRWIRKSLIRKKRPWERYFCVLYY